MIERLYNKSEICFAVIWIITYVVLASTGDNISEDIGILIAIIAGGYALYIALVVKENNISGKGEI